LGGRILSNAGTSYTGTSLLNCFVLGRSLNRNQKNSDSIEGIYNDLKEQAQTLKSEGGWGTNFSHLRPRGTIIGGIGAETPGAVAFMELFDKSSSLITQGSGMKKKYAKTKAKIRKGAMMSILECLAGNTLINTLDGKIPIKNLVGVKPYIYCTDEQGNVKVRQANKVWSKGIKKTIKVCFDNHDFIECTPNHLFLLSSGDWKEAKDLELGDSLAAINRKLYKSKYIYLGIAGSRTYIPEHVAVYEMKYGEAPSCGGSNRNSEDTVAHHIDCVTTNNHPDNIQKVTLSEHALIHGSHLDSHRKRIAKERKGKT